MTVNQIRVRGALVAGLMTFVAGLVIGVGVGVSGYEVPAFPEGVLLAATIGGVLGAAAVAPKLVGDHPGRVASIAEMTAIGYVMTGLLWPLMSAVVAAPSAINGGMIPCIFFGGGGSVNCSHGLTGMDAISSLASNTAAIYPVAFLIDVFAAIPGVPAFLVLSIAWRVVFRRFLNSRATAAPVR